MPADHKVTDWNPDSIDRLLADVMAEPHQHGSGCINTYPDCDYPSDSPADLADLDASVKSINAGAASRVYVFRPMGDGPWLRYADGAWIPDDGKWDVAFAHSAEHYGAPYALYVDVPIWSGIRWKWTTRNPYRWHYEVSDPVQGWGERYEADHFTPKHPNAAAGRAAMSKCTSIHRCANGRGPKFELGDPYMGAGLVRVFGEGLEVVTPPTDPQCYLCLNDAAGHRDAEYSAKREELRDSIKYAREDIEKLEVKLMDAKDELDALELREQEFAR